MMPEYFEPIEGENWRGVPGYEDLYDVSDMGRIRNVKTNRILKGATKKSGYRFVILSDFYTPWNVYVHQLVAQAFIGQPPEGTEVNHKDGNKLNNSASNLEYLTHAENMKHASENGLMGKRAKTVKPVQKRQRGDKLYIGACIICCYGATAIREDYPVCPEHRKAIDDGYTIVHEDGCYRLVDLENIDYPETRQRLTMYVLPVAS